ncbi:hypothetical protein EV702DRAFT_1193494 [Suillus placidus]|uniref:Uncharacterized protein n=1 Tax=Suillus placidus TaxID=48579 RepID=A0A9P7A2K9_9AGAM|nr:hypothetical protein EV702DRAFT_1193494 [Suillus placidus]
MPHPQHLKVLAVQKALSLPAPPGCRPPPQHPDVLAIQRAQPLPAPPMSAAPSISSSKDRNYFFLKKVDLILFSATQTVCPFPSQVKLDFTHEDPDPETIFQLCFNLSRYIQVAATPDDSELKYTGPLFQHLATI